MTEETLAAITELVVRTVHPLRVILFGSQARGDAGPGSDVGLLVVLPSVVDKRQTAIDIRRALASFPVSQDIVVTTPDEIARRGTWSGPCYDRPSAKGGCSMSEPEALTEWAVEARYPGDWPNATTAHARAAAGHARAVWESVRADLGAHGLDLQEVA